MGNKKSKSHGLTANEIAVLKANTNLNDEQIRKEYEEFKTECPSGQMNKSQFKKFYKKFVNADPKDNFDEVVFKMFDANGDGSIDFREFVIACVSQTKKSPDDNLEFIFEQMDTSGDGYVSYGEVVRFMEISKQLAGDNDPSITPNNVASMVFDMFNLDKTQKLSKQQFFQGCKNNQILGDMFGSS